MKKIFALIALSLCAHAMFAQDIITRIDGTDIEGTVTEVNDMFVKYKKFTYPEGPTYTIAISEIYSIRFQNGEIEKFDGYPNYGYNGYYRGGIPRGVMTYNEWSGRISVGGVTIENDMLTMYLDDKDFQTFNESRKQAMAGSIIALVSAVPLGFSLGSMLGMAIAGDPQSKDYQQTMNACLVTAGISGAVFAVGAILDIPAEKKIKAVVNRYNQSLKKELTFQVGPTQNGIGLAINF